MSRQNKILKAILIIVFILVFCLTGRVCALSILKFVGDENETQKMSNIESVFLESARKSQLEAAISNPSADIRWNVATMLAEIGDSQSLNLLLGQIKRETDWLAKDEQIRAVYAIKFREAVLFGGNPENILLEFFVSEFYPFKEKTTSGESFDSTSYVLSQLAIIESKKVRSHINKILALSKTSDLGLLPETCNKALHILNNYRNPQRYVVALRTGDLGLRYWAIKELAKKSKIEFLTPDKKTVIDLLRSQLFFAENNGYDNYYNYINNILKNTYSEIVDYIKDHDIYENQPPIISNVANKNVYEGERVIIVIRASDPDAALPRVRPFVSVRPMPDGAVMRGDVFRWIPSIGQIGQYRITAFAQDEIGSISTTDFTINVLSASPKSIIKNAGRTDLKGYVLMKVQKWDGQSWQDDMVVVDDEQEKALRTIKPDKTINLKGIWNSQAYTAKEQGKFRIYAAFLDEEGNVSLSDTWEFRVQ